MYLSSRQGMYIVAAHFYTLEEEEEEKVLCWLSEDEEGKRKRATSWCHLKPTLVLKKNRQKKERERRKEGGWLGWTRCLALFQRYGDFVERSCLSSQLVSSVKRTTYVCIGEKKGSPATHSSGPRLIIIWHRLLFWVFPFAFLSRPWAPRFIALLTRAASSAFSSRIIRASHSFFLFFCFSFLRERELRSLKGLIVHLSTVGPVSLDVSLHTAVCSYGLSQSEVWSISCWNLSETPSNWLLAL